MAALKRQTRRLSLRQKRRNQERRRRLLARRRSLARQRSLARRRQRERRRTLEKRRRTQERKKSWKGVSKKKQLIPKAKKNVCQVKFPKRGYQMSCPLMLWCFKQWMRQHMPLSEKGKHAGKAIRGAACRMINQKKGQPGSRRCPDFLKAALKDMANKKDPKCVASGDRKRKQDSDDEIFYKLAKPSGAEKKDKKAKAAPGPKEPTARTSGRAQSRGQPRAQPSGTGPQKVSN